MFLPFFLSLIISFSYSLPASGEKILILSVSRINVVLLYL